MEATNQSEMKHCSNCQEFVVFDEIHTRQKMAQGQPKVTVVVFRCPKCQKITRPILPLHTQNK
jgi:RNase P subunit RPR2